MNESASESPATAWLKPKKAQPFFARHPWVFAGAIDRIDGTADDGDPIRLVSNTGSFIAWGLLNRQSKIQVRLYSWDEAEPFNRGLLKSRLVRAIALRHQHLGLAGPDRPAYRVVFSEADGLSGIVVDRFADYCSLQLTSLGMARRREMIADLLLELLPIRGVYLKCEKGIGKLEGIHLPEGVVRGEAPPEEILVQEAGITIAVNLQEGQKTGYYLDQRENRLAVARFCVGKRVLDAFSYSGGFGLHAARAGAREVLCVDSSEGALKLLARNAELNGFAQVRPVGGDVFDTLAGMVKTGEKYDVIVLDPPKFARDRRSVEDALRGYRRLYQLGLNLVSTNGLIVFCCCSGLITQDQIEDVMAQVASKHRRDVQILERRGAAADHPISVACREGSYLKCLITRVSGEPHESRHGPPPT